MHSKKAPKPLKALNPEKKRNSQKNMAFKKKQKPKKKGHPLKAAERSGRLRGPGRRAKGPRRIGTEPQGRGRFLKGFRV